MVSLTWVRLPFSEGYISFLDFLMSDFGYIIWLGLVCLLGTCENGLLYHCACVYFE